MDKAWTVEDHRRLRHLFERAHKNAKGSPTKRAWKLIKQEFADRSNPSLYNRIALIKAGREPTYDKRFELRGDWAEKEETLIAKAVVSLPKRSNGALRRGGVNFIHGLLPHRTIRAINAKIERLSGPLRCKRINRESWTDEEVSKLREAYKQDKFHLGLSIIFPNRRVPDVVAKAGQLGLSRKRLEPVYFRLTDTDAALAAGLILADGHVTLQQKKNRPDSWSVIVGFANSEKVMVDWFGERIPRGRIVIDDQRNVLSPIRHKQIMYQWRLQDKTTVVILLRQLVPYMMGKKLGRAQAILDRFGHLVQ